MPTSLSSVRHRAGALVGLFVLALVLAGCGGGDKTATPAANGSSDQATTQPPAAEGGGLVTAADVKAVDLIALGYQKLVTDKTVLAPLPTVYLPDASVCPRTQNLVPHADGTGASSFKSLTPIIAAESLQAPFIISTLAVNPADLVAAINKATAGCVDVKVTVAPNTPRTGVARVQVNYRTPKFNNGANGGRPMAGLTYIAALKDGSYVMSTLFGDPTQPPTAPRYDLTDPFTAKILTLAGVA